MSKKNAKIVNKKVSVKTKKNEQEKISNITQAPLPEEVSKNDQKAPSGSLSSILAQRKDINFESSNFRPKIVVIGVGGAGGNALNNLIKRGLENVETIACNTDAQALENSLANNKIQLGPKSTMGLGAGANPDVGKLSAQESEKEIRKVLSGAHMAFVVAGLGGGTGNGAGPEIAKIAIEMGILTVGFVTTPFDFEGAQRKSIAQNGLKIFQENSDVLVVVGNQNLFSLSNEETTFLEAFAIADEVLCTGVQSVVKTVSESGLINTDLADFFTIMKGRKSRARMGTGIAEGLDRGLIAAQEAMASPLLELDGMMSKDIDGVVICIRCGNDMTLNDVNQAVDYIRQAISSEANLIFGATLDKEMEGKVQVSIFATTSSKDKEEDIFYKPKILEYNEPEETIDSFEQLVNEDLEIGRPHGEILHEDSQNENIKHFETVKRKSKKKGFFRKLFTFWKKDEEDDLPPYFKDDEDK